jgi:predicted transcriptional regulator
MLQITLKIDPENVKAMALLNYIKTLEFVLVETTIELTDDQKNAVDTGIDALNYGRITKHQDVVHETKKRYPDLY